MGNINIKSILTRVGEEVLKNPDATQEASSKAKAHTEDGSLNGMDASTLSMLKTLTSLLHDFLSGDYREIARSSIALIVGALVYTIAPIDAIADCIPVLGLADDALVISMAVGYLTADIVCYLAWKDADSDPTTPLNEYLDRTVGDNEEERQAEISRLAAIYDDMQAKTNIEKAVEILKSMESNTVENSESNT